MKQHIKREISDYSTKLAPKESHPREKKHNKVEIILMTAEGEQQLLLRVLRVAFPDLSTNEKEFSGKNLHKVTCTKSLSADCFFLSFAIRR